MEAKFSSLIGSGTANIFPGTEPSLPSTSARPTPPPRSDSIPMLDINITPQTIQETVKAMERQGPKVKRFQKYLQKQTSEDQEVQLLIKINNILSCEYTKVYSIMLDNNGSC